MDENSILRALDVPVYTTDAEGRITFYNEAAALLWGYWPELGSRWCGSWRIYTQEGAVLPHDQCPMAIAIKEGRVVRGVEAVVERPDGTRIPFLPYPTPIRDETGKIIGAVNLLIDLTDRHRVSEESARLAAIVSSSDDAIASKTLEGIVTSWNAGAERIFGYTAEEMIGQPILRIIPPELHHEERSILSQLRRGERIEHFETVRVAKDGRRVDVSLTVSPIRDAYGHIIGASKVARDISERKRAEEVQQLLIDELNHRIKNTLATVQAIANQTLRRAKGPDDFVSSFNGRIQALAKAHGLLTSASFQGADVRQLVREQLMLGGAEDQRISCAGPSVTLESQAALHLALVLHELGTNARKHGALSTPAGNVNVHWEVLANGGRQLILDWTESGGPKVSAPTNRGFGSILIEQSLRAHSGQVTMRFAEQGVSCHIVLPMVQVKPPPFATPAPSPPMQRSQKVEGKLAGKRILIVEDEAIIAMVLEDYLVEAGCTVVGPAHTLDAAKQLIAENDFDAALLDANLGGHSVGDIAAGIAQKQRPFLFVTGYGREAFPEAFRDAPAIEKPFTPEQVLAGLERLFEAPDNVVSLRKRP